MSSMGRIKRLIDPVAWDPMDENLVLKQLSLNPN